jgi:capsular exopolysaccharide synthesis family protein
MTLNEYLGAITKHWAVITLCAILGAVLGYGYAKSQPPTYQASASVMVVPEQGQNSAELVQGSNYVQNLVASYAVLARSPYVLEPVIDRLELDVTPVSLGNRVTVDTPLNSVVISVSVQDGSPEQAQQVANAITRQLAVAVPQLSPELEDESPAVRVTTIAEASLPVNPIAPNTRLLTALGLAVGAAIGFVYAVIRLLLARRVSNWASLQNLSDVPLLGQVIRAPRGMSLPKAVLSAPNAPPAESLRTLLANLRFADLDNDHRVLMVSSGNPMEGKSSVAAGLALALAEEGAKVLLVDADLRRPSIARLTGLEGAAGLTNLLLGDVDLESVVQTWGHETLDVLPSGVVPPNPGALLGSGQLAKVVVDLRKAYEFVIIDSAPLLPLSDPLLLAQHVDGVIVVARAGKTRITRLKETLEGFRRSGADVLGVALNAVRPGRQTDYFPRESGLHLRRRGRR